MRSPAQLVWEAHGAPQVEGCSSAQGRCYVCCGAAPRGKTVRDWLQSSFTDQNRCRSPLSTHVCEACCYVQSRIAPVLGRPPGKCTGCDGTGKVTKIAKKGKTKDAKVGDPCPKCEGSGAQTFGGNMRNYAHLYEDGWDSPEFAAVKDEEGEVVGHNGPAGLGYINASKGEKPAIREFLAREHRGIWFAAIADSGQKHVLPFTPLNGPGSRSGVVLFEESLVTVPDDQSLIGDMTALLTAGVTKDEIGSGNYYIRTMRERRELAQGFEAGHGHERGSPWFSLAIWLAQRDEEESARRVAAEKEAKGGRKAKKKTGNARGGDGADAAERVPQCPGRAPADELLGATPEPVQGGGSPNDDGERVGERSAEANANRQLSLF